MGKARQMRYFGVGSVVEVVRVESRAERDEKRVGGSVCMQIGYWCQSVSSCVPSLEIILSLVICPYLSCPPAPP